MHRSPSASSFSVGTVFQYAFLALVVYVLAGAPLQEIFLSGRDGSSYSYSRDASASPMSPQKLESLVIPEANLTCDEHAFKSVHVLSREPLVVYIEGFLGEKEADEVVELRYVDSVLFFIGDEARKRSSSCCGNPSGVQ